MFSMDARCVNCNNKANFDIEKNKIKCEKCGMEIDYDEYIEQMKEKQEEAAKKKETKNETESLIDKSASLEQVKNLDKVKHDKIMAFLAYYVNFENQDMMRIFEKEVQQLTRTTTPMGVKEILLERRKQEGIEIGIQKAEARKNHDFVENLITKLSLSDEQAADIAEVTIEFVAKVREELKNK